MIPYLLYVIFQVDCILRQLTLRDLDVVLGYLPGKLFHPSLTDVLGFQILPFQIPLPSFTLGSSTTTPHNYSRSVGSKLPAQLGSINYE